MADAASLALGIPPLLALAIHSYGSLYEKAQVYCRYAGAVERLCKHLETQRQLFLNECHFLLRLVVDDKRTIRAMVVDTRHRNWEDQALAQRWSNCLGRNYRACTGIVEEIHDTLRGLDEEMQRFNSISLERQREEDKRATFKRVRYAVKMALGSTQYDQTIAALRSTNGDLRMLRKHLYEFHTEKNSNRRPLIRRCEMKRGRDLGDYNTVRCASQALHRTLTTAWCCSQVTHLNHSAKLFVDSKVDRDVSLDLLILSETSLVDTKPSNTLHLSIRSYSRTYVDTTSAADNPEAEAACSRAQQARSICREAISSECALKKRRLRFSDDSSTVPRINHNKKEEAGESKSIDLGRSNDICSELSSSAIPCQPSLHTTNCLGYLDAVDNNYRHVFFPRTQGAPTFELNSPMELVPVQTLLKRPLDHTLTVVDQLKLAARLVTGMMQFYSTPWLAEYWDLQDFSVFLPDNEFSDEVLRSLHVSTDFLPRNHDHNHEGCSMTGVERSHPFRVAPALEELRLRDGIRSLPLYSLGVVLLQIGRWMSLDARDTFQVRRLADQSTRLGPRYREIVKRCLECDFGFGADLQKPQLQTAVDDAVLGELSAMIDTLDINRED